MNDSAQNQAVSSPQSIQRVVTESVVTHRDDSGGGSHLANVQSHYFLRGEQTGNAYSLTEILFQPGAQGTPLHLHHREEELYYVIEGKLDVRLGDQQLTLEAGGSVLLPRGIPHKVTPSGQAKTRALMLISPPGLENMLAELDRVNTGGLDLAAVQRLASAYQIELLPE